MPFLRCKHLGPGAKLDNPETGQTEGARERRGLESSESYGFNYGILWNYGVLCWGGDEKAAWVEAGICSSVESCIGGY